MGALQADAPPFFFDASVNRGCQLGQKPRDTKCMAQSSQARLLMFPFGRLQNAGRFCGLSYTASSLSRWPQPSSWAWGALYVSLLPVEGMASLRLTTAGDCFLAARRLLSGSSTSTCWTLRAKVSELTSPQLLCTRWLRTQWKRTMRTPPSASMQRQLRLAHCDGQGRSSTLSRTRVEVRNLDYFGTSTGPVEKCMCDSGSSKQRAQEQEPQRTEGLEDVGYGLAKYKGTIARSCMSLRLSLATEARPRSEPV